MHTFGGEGSTAKGGPGPTRLLVVSQVATPPPLADAGIKQRTVCGWRVAGRHIGSQQQEFTQVWQLEVDAIPPPAAVQQLSLAGVGCAYAA